MEATKIVLQNAKAQLEAQKKTEYDNAYASKYAELKTQVDAFAAQKRQERDEAINQLTAAYNDAVEAKRKHCDDAINAQIATIDATAKNYADTRIAEIDKLIEQVAALAEE